MKAYAITLGIVVGCVVAPSTTAADICDQVSSLAKTIMDGRQSGVEMAKMMDLASGCSGKSGDDLKFCKTFQPILKSMIVAAYKEPRFSTPAYQQQEVTDFANKMYLACYENTHKDK